MEEDLVRIRIDLKMMAQEIHGLIQHRADNIQRLVESSIEEYCSKGKLEAAVQKEVEQALNESIRSFFQTGDGRYHVQKAVTNSMKAVLNGEKND